MTVLYGIGRQSGNGHAFSQFRKSMRSTHPLAVGQNACECVQNRLFCAQKVWVRTKLTVLYGPGARNRVAARTKRQRQARPERTMEPERGTRLRRTRGRNCGPGAGLQRDRSGPRAEMRQEARRAAAHARPNGGRRRSAGPGGRYSFPKSLPTSKLSASELGASSTPLPSRVPS